MKFIFALGLMFSVSAAQAEITSASGTVEWQGKSIELSYEAGGGLFNGWPCMGFPSTPRMPVRVMICQGNLLGPDGKVIGTEGASIVFADGSGLAKDTLDPSLYPDVPADMTMREWMFKMLSEGAPADPSNGSPLEQEIDTASCTDETNGVVMIAGMKDQKSLGSIQIFCANLTFK